MTEKGPSINMQSLETRFTVGKVEKPIENKIEDTARKIIGENILKDEGHASGFERDVKADGVVESLGYGFKTYADMLSAMNDPNRPAMKEKAGEAFDILRKSVSVAMNSGVDQELQTRLYVGTGKVEEVLPRPWREIHPGTPEVILAEAVVESVITDQNILKTVRQLDKVRTRVDVGNKNERELLAGKIETEVGNLLFMEVSEEKENELVAVKSFLSTEAGILRGELGVEDKSADKEDVAVVLGEKMVGVAEKMTQAAEKMVEAAEKSGEAGGGRSGRNIPPRQRTNEEGEFEGYEPAWVVSEEKAAEAMKFMADDLRWSSWTPPEWFRKKEGLEQYRIEIMVMVNDGASYLSKFQNSDVDRCRTNPLYQIFDNEKFSALFNDDFKLVTSKMLHDLCEPYKNQDGFDCLRYKEVDTKDGGRVVDPDVVDKLKNIREYKDEMADFLAKQNGREKPNAMDQMNAYSAWNLWFMMGDSSFADRLRAMPPAKGLISDKLRTLNPESKAIRKWKVINRDATEGKDDLLMKAEWFGGPLATYVETVMQLERDLGNPLDGKKKLREKIIDGDMNILSNQTCYGFYDLVDSRNLYRKATESEKADARLVDKINKKGEIQITEPVTLSKMLLDYADFEDGKLVRKTGRDFSFGTAQMDCLADFRDMQEAAVDSFNYLTGKVPAAKDMDGWVNKLRSTSGLASGIDVNGKPLLTYTRRPDYWANALLGSFGVDMTRLSTEYIYMKTPKEISESGYNLYLYRLLVDEMNLSNKDVNLNEVMRYLGVNVKQGADPRGFGLTIATDKQRYSDEKRTSKLYRELAKKTEFDQQSVNKRIGVTKFR